MTEFIIKAAQFFLSLSILIVLHELGHFIPAKLFKTRVEKFYLFFDPYFSLFKKKIGETEYGIGWLPLGGYVKISGMIDESMDTEQLAQEPQPWEFRSKPAWQRLIIMLGGVAVNMLLAVFIYAMLFNHYGEQYLPLENMKYGIAVNELGEELGFKTGDKIISIDGQKPKSFGEVSYKVLVGKEVLVNRGGQEIKLPITLKNAGTIIKKKTRFLEARIPEYKVGKIAKDMPAAKSDLKIGDKIVGVNGQKMQFFDEFIVEIPKHKGEAIKLDIVRDGKVLQIPITVSEGGKIGVRPTGKLSDYYDIATKEYSFFTSFPRGIEETKNKLVGYVKQFRLIFSSETGAYKEMGGFVAIGKQFSATWDWYRFWNFTAFLSIMLAFVNILPIPALDGGHALFTIFEMITGRKPSENFLEKAQIVGFVILMSLVLFVNGNDIYKLIMEKFFS